MNKAKSIAKILFFTTRFLAIIYCCITVYSILCLSTGLSTTIHSVNQTLDILYPFTQNSILSIDNNLTYMIFEFITPLSLYSLFFFLSSKVFKAFYQPKLFTQYGITQLKLFYLSNIMIPILITLLSSIFIEIESYILLLIIVHFVLGIFAYFIHEIFKQGLQLQNEQDLFI
ncbi:DUF2975 domain-containing protein [Flavivirga rizhaonensis]|uniref:DUF2975 domain-containing protein n=1 Tax=Flavivirga rizhaonensis TaxID=2559571 RepID=A0A4V3P5B8_9FLAO|nr:DUF2975 domain-containing protein [Flavivirga rizhaonensis]